ncbi:stage II sporulation protein M [Methanimicrococcus sp. OttesenSCG-928-J09]|nr:stage II sporulation protein M [Methanimicrococcus sp. OttesenSCG-928-J09]
MAEYFNSTEKSEEQSEKKSVGSEISEKISGESFSGFIDFDAAFLSAPASIIPPESALKRFLNKISGPLFWTMFLFFCFIFVGYFAYFLFTVFSPLNPQFFDGLLNAFYLLPQPIIEVVSLLLTSHLLIAAGLAFLNLIVSFADQLISKDSIDSVNSNSINLVNSVKTYLKSLFAPLIKPLAQMAGLFLISVAISYVIGYFYPEISEFIFNFGGLPGGGSFEVMLFIFFNNTRIVFMLIFLGFFFGILPISVVLVNGFAIGIVAEYTIKSKGLVFLLTGLLPHGIIEIPIILLGAGVGYNMGIQATQTLRKCKTFEAFKQNFIGCTWIFFLFVVPLLFVAAIIEVYVTGPLLGVVF